jgi:hypothetical protein
MTSTTIKGLGLAEDLDFGPTYSSGNPQTFGEPAIFPGGISYGTVAFVDGKFQTDGGKSSIEVVNLLLGQGNDNFKVLGTLDPDVAVKLTGTVVLTALPSGAPGFPTATVKLTRPQPFDWKSQGFLVGQPFHISGTTQTWTVVGFGDDNLADTVDKHGHVPDGDAAPRRRSSTRSRSTSTSRRPCSASRSPRPRPATTAPSPALPVTGSWTGSSSASGSRPPG